MTMYDGASNSNTNYATLLATSNSAPSPQVCSASSEQFATYAAWKAFNQDGGTTESHSELTTITSGVLSTPWSLMVDLGEGNEELINKYALTRCSALGAVFNPYTWILQGSNTVGCTAADAKNDNGWTDLHTHSYAAIVDGAYITFSLGASYRYYRLRVTSVRDDMTTTTTAGLGELRLVAQILPIEGDAAEFSETTDSVTAYVAITADVSESSTSTDAVNGTKDQEIEDVIESSESTDAADVFQSNSICDVAEESESTDSVAAIAGIDVDVSESSASTDAVVVYNVDVVDVAESSTSTDAVDATNRSVDDIDATISQEFPALTTGLYAGAYLDQDFPALTSSIAALTGRICTIAETFPALTTDGMYSGAEISDTFPALTTAIAGSVDNPCSISQTFPTLSGTISALTGTISTIDSDFPALTTSMSSYMDIAATVADTFPSLKAGMDASASIACSIADTFPALITASAAITGIFGTIADTFPALTNYVHAGSATSYQTFCMDILKKELVSKFTNYSFDTYGIIGGKAVGGKSTGLYLLEGETDAGTAIVSSMTTPALTFGTYLEKKLRSFNLIGRFGGNMQLSASNGRDTAWQIAAIMRGGMAVESKQDYFPHAARGDSFIFTFTNPDGDDFMLDTITLNLFFLERR